MTFSLFGSEPLEAPRKEFIRRYGKFKTNVDNSHRLEIYELFFDPTDEDDRGQALSLFVLDYLLAEYQQVSNSVVVPISPNRAAAYYYLRRPY